MANNNAVLTFNTAAPSSDEGAAGDWREELAIRLWGARADDGDKMIYYHFPPAGHAAAFGYDGLLGCTEIITPQLVLSAYLQGVFPWYDTSDPPMWWRPEPRFALPIERLHVGSRMERTVRTAPFTYKMDSDFYAVITACAEQKRKGQRGTWIGSDMIECYCELARRGIAHSVEAWHEGALAGGFYGVLIGSVFCGESMFTRKSNSSKCAFVTFARAFEHCGGRLIDSQTYTQNMARYGARNISSMAFMRLEETLLRKPLTMDIKTALEGTPCQ